MSAALQHLRAGVTLAAAVLALSLAARVSVWAVVHYTEVRLENVAADAPVGGPLTVVRAPESGEAVPGATRIELPQGAEQAVAAEQPVPIQINTQPGAMDVLMARMGEVVQWVGILSALMLAALMTQGVFLAGAASVPGVERAVGAWTWALVIVFLCLPLQNVLSTLPMKGVFQPYAEIVRDSVALRSGAPEAPSALMFYGSYLALPGAMLLALLLSIWRFRAGVEQGIIITSASEIDERLEREIRAMKLGQLAAPRAVGALNAAIGDTPATGPLPVGVAGSAGASSAAPSHRGTMDLSADPRRAAPNGRTASAVAEEEAPSRPRAMVDQLSETKRRPI